MRFHCLGAGSIGSLIASNLAQLPATSVRLVLRKKDLAKSLLTSEKFDPSNFTNKSSPTQNVSLKIERTGLAYRTDGITIELTPTPEDKKDASRLESLSPVTRGRGIGASSSKFKNLIKNDPIDSLIITTKAPSVISAIRPLLPRISSKSTVFLCHNGMGVLERILETYYPEDSSTSSSLDSISDYRSNSRPSFICALTTHAVWRKGNGHFVHAGVGDIKFTVVPNRAALASIASTPSPSWGDHSNNPLLNSRSLVLPTLEHIPLTPATESLHSTLSSFLKLKLDPNWLPLPTFRIAQLQKLAVNASVNSLTAVIGVNNGSLMGSQYAKSLISKITTECSNVFAAHLARESGTWNPPSSISTSTSSLSDSSDITSRSNSYYNSIPSPIYPPPPPLPFSHPLSAASLLDYTLRLVFSTSTNLSSTLQDILAAKPGVSTTNPSATEIDFINEYIVALGNRYGISTTAIETFGKLVKLKEEMIRSGAVDIILERRIQESADAADVVKTSSSTSSLSAASKDKLASLLSMKSLLGSKKESNADAIKSFEVARKVLATKNKRINDQAINISRNKIDG